ncbi:MAG: tyrosine-type recombinase/integrase [Acidobacteriota bacterium]
MTFRTIRCDGLPASRSPFRVVDREDRELEWVNDFPDAQCVRGVQPLTLRSYANLSLPFVRWWNQQPNVDIRNFRAERFTESTLVDYVRSQVDRRPKPSPEHINMRSTMLRRLFRFHFYQDMPHSPYLIQRSWYCRSPLGYGRGRTATASADLKLKVPQRVIQPLSREQVQRFWHSFRTARDLAMVALMLLNGLRSREVLALQLEDLLFGEAQVRVHGKGARLRLLPPPPETIRPLRCYLQTERPLTNASQVFVSLKGHARGRAMTPAGLRSSFRRHRKTSSVAQANPHRFRHTFGSDMVCAGVSLPALRRLMGHAHIQTTLLYIQLAPQDVFAEYARAVAQIARLAQPPLV